MSSGTKKNSSKHISCEQNTFFFVNFFSSTDGAHSDESPPDPSQPIYAEFDDDFEDEELAAPIGRCTAMYSFPGMLILTLICF